MQGKNAPKMCTLGAAEAGVAWASLAFIGSFFLCLIPATAQLRVIEPSDAATAQLRGIEPSDACVDFGPGGVLDLPWTLEDCVDVWEDFALTVPNGLQPRLPHVDVWRKTSAELRQAGSPCLVASNPTSDGAGSSTIRHLATWIYAEQMGCDWVTPDWGKKHLATEGNGTAVMYCHRTATTEEMDLSKPTKELQAMRRCSVVDWLSYFQFDVPSVSLPESDLVYVENDVRSIKGILDVQEDIHRAGILSAPWSHVVFTFHPSYASSLLLNAGSWDGTKRQLVRRVFHEARENFHRHPRPWYDENPQCSFDKDRMNFAIHVRMGDRREFQDGNLEYFQLLELIMDIIAEEVASFGLPKPLFHVFSETLAPCPSEDTGLFDEFPTWPVRLDQVPACVAAPTPDDCPEKRAGAFCSPTRSGIFDVVGKDLILHVGADVQNALSCMIQADGVLMGCSTFGQVAGLLTRGIKMFSTSCGGDITPIQYKTIPPIAVAEMGHLWVPIAGSWRDPAMKSRALFRKALEAFTRGDSRPEFDEPAL